MVTPVNGILWITLIVDNLPLYDYVNIWVYFSIIGLLLQLLLIVIHWATIKSNENEKFSHVSFEPFLIVQVYFLLSIFNLIVIIFNCYN